MKSEEKGNPLVDGAWAGDPAFVVGGGPSLKSLDWSLLKDRKHIIVINRAYVDCPAAEVFITEDARFIERYAGRDDWKAFKGVKILSLLDDAYRAQVEPLDPSVVFIRAREKRYGWGKRLADGLSMSSNSAIPALNLADILGANPIFLIGIDCRAEGNAIMNYHDEYPESWKIGTHQLDSFKSDFEHWAALHLKHRQVINLNLESAVTCWPKCDRDSFLKAGNALEFVKYFAREVAMRVHESR